MAAILTANNSYVRVKKYFIAWQTYDLKLLCSIFSPTAKYIIRNKNRSLNGIEEIEQYWQRNKRRQKDIQLRWKIIRSRPHTDEVEFYAYFGDIEEQKIVRVFGRIIFTYNATEQIIKLSEAYRVKSFIQGSVPVQKQKIFGQS